MSTTTAKRQITTEETEPEERWQRLLFWLLVIALIITAIGTRLYQLGVPFDRDGYDEGVYWLSLRAMSAGHPLYSPIFYSQPPFFLLSIFPMYALFGSTLWSARLGIVFISLSGLLGAFLLGKALSGRVGAIAALLLVVVDPLFLAQSQRIEAEAPFAALSLLAIGLAFSWWNSPSGKRGMLLAALTGITVSLSILSKLLGVALLVPVALLMAARAWQGWSSRSAGNMFGRDTSGPYVAMGVGIAACLITAAALIVPFAGSWQAMWSGVVTFHTDAARALSSSQAGNSALVKTALVSWLGLAALYGTIAALLRRDWRALPLLAWLLVTLYLLWRQVPLFGHHLVALTPPLIALATIGIADGTSFRQLFCRAAFSKVVTYLTWGAVLLMLLTSLMDARVDRVYYRDAGALAVNGQAQLEARIARDVQSALSPNQQIITDQQFIAGLANRETPPELVDTSMVRITSGYLTLTQLETIAARPQVQAVLFFSGRFSLPPVSAFHAWVAQRFHLLHNYGGGRELWVK